MDESNLPPPLDCGYYQQPTLMIARDLLGKTLWRKTAEGVVAGTIVETEAYVSAIDPASHNYRKPSKRSATMFGPPGHAYVYLTYGMYHCFNIVTEPEGQSAAVLIRAVAPTVGAELMAERCPPTRAARDLARGPARLCQAFDLTLADNGLDMTGDTLWVSDSPPLTDAQVATSSRIGISQGIDLPWRFFVVGHPAISGRKAFNTRTP